MTGWLDIDKLPPKMDWEYQYGVYFGFKLFNNGKNKLHVIVLPTKIEVHLGFQAEDHYSPDLNWEFMPMGYCTLGEDETLVGREGKVGHYVRMVLKNQISSLKNLAQETIGS